VPSVMMSQMMEKLYTLRIDYYFKFLESQSVFGILRFYSGSISQF
jgi:hypothetical protein